MSQKLSNSIQISSRPCDTGTAKAAGTVEVRLSLPEEFFKVTKIIADLAERSVEEYIIRSLILMLEADMGQYVGDFMYPVLNRERGFQEQLLVLAGLEG